MPTSPQRVLIVDDEGTLRRALERWLLELGHEAFSVGTVKEAVKLLGSEKISLVLLDLRLPGIQGMTLLQGLDKHAVPIPVIVISGTGDIDAAIEAFRTGAVDYLRKPFTLDELSAAIERALGRSVTQPTPPGEGPVSAPAPGPTQPLMPAYDARGTTVSDEPRRTTSLGGARTRSLEERWGGEPVTRRKTTIVPEVRRVTESTVTGMPGLKVRLARAASKLPLLDPRVARLRTLVEEAGTLDQVVQLVERDPALATAVLRTARSGFYAVREPPASLRDACVHLGNKRVFTIAFEVLVRNQFTVRKPRYKPLFESMWRNALVSARAASHLAKLVREVDPEEMHLAAFLHNIGELVLVQFLAEHEDPSELAPLDLQSLGDQAKMVHEDSGAHIASRWKLAPQLIRLAGYHHRPTRMPEPEEEMTSRRVVMAAWTIALRAGFTYFPEQEEEDLVEHLAMLGLTEEDAEPLLEQAPGWVSDT